MTDLGAWGKTTSPYHRGERAIHRRFGLYDQQTEIARTIHRPDMELSHQQFLASLEYVVLASIDEAGRPWASMLFGERGFAHAIDAKTVDLDAVPLPGDRLAANMVVGSPMSILGLELASRRRIRANVTFTEALDPGLRLHIDQSYGNCPKYIQKRTVELAVDEPAQATEVVDFDVLDTEVVEIIERSDTFFVASHNNEDDQHDVGGVDVNHRGGRPGFVRVEGNTLTIPDFSGNFAFNTLGNFMINPVAGLLFVDFESGDIVQLTGRTEILWDGHEDIAEFKGAQRAWTFTLDSGVLLRNASPARWAFVEHSPTALRTGSWADL